MTTAEQLHQVFDTLPENMQAEVLSYINYLQYKLSDFSQDTSNMPVHSEPSTDKQTQLYEMMNQISAQPHAYQGVDVLAWQNEVRQDKALAMRDE